MDADMGPLLSFPGPTLTVRANRGAASCRRPSQNDADAIHMTEERFDERNRLAERDGRHPVARRLVRARAERRWCEAPAPSACAERGAAPSEITAKGGGGSRRRCRPP
jgi:hypothetical protein